MACLLCGVGVPLEWLFLDGLEEAAAAPEETETDGEASSSASEASQSGETTSSLPIPPLQGQVLSTTLLKDVVGTAWSWRCFPTHFAQVDEETGDT